MDLSRLSPTRSQNKHFNYYMSTEDAIEEAPIPPAPPPPPPPPQEQQSSCYPTLPDNTSNAATTLMVRNLPDDLSQPAMVEKFIDQGFTGLFDFVYMPMNFRGKGNFGYAFVNFASHEVASHVMMQMQPHEEDNEDAASSGR